MQEKRASEPLQLAVLASGRGSNFEAIYQAIQNGGLNARICVLISDKESAPVLDKGRRAGIPSLYVNPRQFEDKGAYEKQIVQEMTSRGVELVVLAGYMRLVGSVLLDCYPNRVINIHPALLPSFKGLEAHKQALDYGVKYSGCTVHFVDAGMDSGPIIMQSVVPVMDNDDEASLAARILIEEHRLYPAAIQAIADGRITIDGRRVRIAAP